MKIKLQILNQFTGSVIFEYEKENNTIADTVNEAIRVSLLKGENANLRSADLRSADLSFTDLNSADLSFTDLNSANLSYANLRSANLNSADLNSANLSYANLRSANLNSADLHSANLRSANLRSANLHSANLRSANLSSANLRSANLSYANLSSADLSSANLSSANLSSANLHSANLSSANLRSAEGSDYAIAITRICPEGDIIGYKKCQNNIIVKLLIPKEAKRNNAFGRKCRAEFADVIDIYGADKAISKYDPNFIYEVGKRMFPTEPFNEDFTNECSSGIHFFITKIEAENF